MGRHFASNSLTLFVVVLFLLGALIKTLQVKYTSPSLLQEAICLEVASGSSISGIAEKLQTQGAVSSKTLFQLGIDYSGRRNELKAGSYLVPAGSSMSQIADQITTSGRNTCGTEVIFRVGVTRNTVLVRELDPTTNRYVEVSRVDLDENFASDFYLSALKDDDSMIRLAISEGTTSWSIVNALKGLNVLDGPIIDMPQEGLSLIHI